MNHLGNWILGGATTVMAVGGLFVAARAGYGVAYYGGLAYFLFAVLFVMLLVKASYDHDRNFTSLAPLRGFFVKLGGALKLTDTDARAARPVVRAITPADLREVLARGFDDYKTMPTHLVFLVVIYPLITLVFARTQAGYDVLPLIFPLLAGYTLIGPLVATGMYELSRRREQNLDISRRHAFDIFRFQSFGAIAALGIVLMVIYFVWLFAAQVIYQSTFGGAAPVSVAAFAREVLATQAGWTLITVGSGVGFVFAVVVFTLSVVSFPMLVDRDVGVFTAVNTSINAVLRNPLTMGLWGLIVAISLLIGSLPFFAGLAVVLPVLGHASWHLYRKVVEY